MRAGADCPTFQDLARMRGRAATRGWLSSRSTSARVATLTCSRVLVRDTFVFTMVHSVINGLRESVPSVTPVPGLTRRHLWPCLNPIRRLRNRARAINMASASAFVSAAMQDRTARRVCCAVYPGFCIADDRRRSRQA